MGPSGTLRAIAIAFVSMGPSLALSTAVVLAGENSSKAAKSVAPSPEPLSYIIGAGDVLHLFVWKEPELTRDVTVRLDGKITVPLLGDVEAAGRTPVELGADIGKNLGRFMTTPSVTVGIAQARSARFYVLGEVAKPGDYPFPGGINVLQALALAGGCKEYAKTDRILIIRQEGGTQIVMPVNYKRLASGRDLTQNILLRPGDTIVVP